MRTVLFASLIVFLFQVAYTDDVFTNYNIILHGSWEATIKDNTNKIIFDFDMTSFDPKDNEYNTYVRVLNRVNFDQLLKQGLYYRVSKYYKDYILQIYSYSWMQDSYRDYTGYNLNVAMYKIILSNINCIYLEKIGFINHFAHKDYSFEDKLSNDILLTRIGNYDTKLNNSLLFDYSIISTNTIFTYDFYRYVSDVMDSYSKLKGDYTISNLSNFIELTNKLPYYNFNSRLLMYRMEGKELADHIKSYEHYSNGLIEIKEIKKKNK